MPDSSNISRFKAAVCILLAVAVIFGFAAGFSLAKKGDRLAPGEPEAVPSTTAAQESTTAKTEPAKKKKTDPLLDEIKNGSISKKDGVYYITDEQTGVKFIIVNKSYGLPKDFGPGRLKKKCREAFEKLAAAAKEEGLILKIGSGYRSYSAQKAVYDSFVKARGRESADQIAAKPGFSEHQTGMAIDINTSSDVFTGSKEGNWLSEHCAEYGFIVRYGEEKTDSTGYKYESWHVRYLGSVKLAKMIYKSGMSIEEYYGIPSEYK